MSGVTFPGRQRHNVSVSDYRAYYDSTSDYIGLEGFRNFVSPAVLASRGLSAPPQPMLAS